MLWPRRLMRLLRRDDGISLIVAIGVLGVLAATGATLVSFASSSARSASYSEANDTAFAAAEAGVNHAAALLAEAATPTDPAALPPGSATIDRASVSWSGKVDSNGTWTITAVATVPNPTGPGAAEVTRTVTRQFRVDDEPGMAGNEAWHYLYADSTEMCSEFRDGVVLTSPLFVRGGACFSGSARMRGGVGTTLKVGETLQTHGAATIGSTTERVEEVAVGRGCRYGTAGSFQLPCSSSHKVYPSSFSSSPGSISKPPIDLDRWYGEAKPGPRSYCSAGSGFPGGPFAFDNDGVRNRSASPVDLFPATGYDCRVTSNGEEVGRISWTTGNPGRLVVKGVAFFDGNLDLTGGDNVVYSGAGVVYASGTVTLANNTNVCGVSSCATSGWDPNANLLVLISGTSTDDVGFLMQSGSRFQGAVYAINDFHQRDGSLLEGPVVARRLILENTSVGDKWVPLAGLKPGMPSYGAKVVVTPVAGSWSG